MDAPRSNGGEGGRDRTVMAIGVILVVFGFAMLLDRASGEGGRLAGRLWPLVLVVLGGNTLAMAGHTRRGRGKRRSGAWLVYLGGWGFVNEFHVFGLSYRTSWPLLVIGVGVLTVWRAVEESRVRARREP
jgi:hypothetical protein